MNPSSTTSRRHAWRGGLAITLSLLGLAVCVCLATLLSTAAPQPNLLDRFFNLRPGQANLFRITYASGDQGYLSENVVSLNGPDYVSAGLVNWVFGGKGLLIPTTAIQLHATFTNWQGSSDVHFRDAYYTREGDQLLLIALTEQEVATLYEPALRVWTSVILREPITSTTTINGRDATFHLELDRREPVTLPNGRKAEALVIVSKLFIQDELFSQTTNWYVRDVGLVRSEQRDDQNSLTQQLELLSSSRLSENVTLPISRPQTSATAFFREDPARTGAHLDASLPAADFKIAYRLQTSRAIVASPVVADGQLYVSDLVGQVVARDARQGTLRWYFDMGGVSVAAPAVANGVVYVASSAKTLYALEAQNGLYLWSRKLSDNLAASPVVVGDMLFVACEDHRLYALDALTGAERWTFTTEGRLISSPAVAEGRIFVGSTDSALYALDMGNGKVLWRHALTGPIGATPAVSADGVVYAATIGGQVNTPHQIVAIQADTGNELWSRETTFGFHASPAIGESLLFLADEAGWVWALDQKSGETAWLRRNANGNDSFSSPLLLADRLLVADAGGLLHTFDALSGQELQTLDLGGKISASPTWKDDIVFVANELGEIYALRASNDEISLLLNPLWQHRFQVGQGVVLATSPIQLEDVLYTVLSNGDLMAYDADANQETRLIQFNDRVAGQPAYRDGVLYVVTTTGHMLAYDLDQKKITWQTALDGQFLFGPAVDDERLYLQRLRPNNQLYALDARTGEIIWVKELESSNATPVLANGMLYAIGENVVALDPETGAEIWRSEIFYSLGGLAEYDGTVYVASVGVDQADLIALNAATGQTQWRLTETSARFTTRPAYDEETQTVFVGSRDGQLYAYDAKTGSQRWRFQADGTIQSSVQVQAGAVYFITFKGTLYAVQAETGNLLSNYRATLGRNLTYPEPLVLPDRLIMPYGAIDWYAVAIEK